MSTFWFLRDCFESALRRLVCRLACFMHLIQHLIRLLTFCFSRFIFGSDRFLLNLSDFLLNFCLCRYLALPFLVRWASMPTCINRIWLGAILDLLSCVCEKQRSLNLRFITSATPVRGCFGYNLCIGHWSKYRPKLYRTSNKGRLTERLLHEALLLPLYMCSVFQLWGYAFRSRGHLGSFDRPSVSHIQYCRY